MDGGLQSLTNTLELEVIYTCIYPFWGPQTFRLKTKSVQTKPRFSKKRGGGGGEGGGRGARGGGAGDTCHFTYNGLDWEAPPGRGTFFRLEVYTKGGISRVEV